MSKIMFASTESRHGRI